MLDSALAALSSLNTCAKITHRKVLVNTRRDVQSLIPPSIPITVDISQMIFHSHLQSLLYLQNDSQFPAESQLQFPLPPLAGQPLALLLPSLNLTSHQNIAVPPGLPGKSGPCHTLPCTACPGTSQKEAAEASEFTTSPPSASPKHPPNLSAEGGAKLPAAVGRRAWDSTSLPRGGSVGRQIKVVKVLSPRKETKYIGTQPTVDSAEDSWGQPQRG